MQTWHADISCLIAVNSVLTLTLNYVAGKAHHAMRITLDIDDYTSCVMHCADYILGAGLSCMLSMISMYFSYLRRFQNLSDINAENVIPQITYTYK